MNDQQFIDFLRFVEQKMGIMDREQLNKFHETIWDELHPDDRHSFLTDTDNA